MSCVMAIVLRWEHRLLVWWKLAHWEPPIPFQVWGHINNADVDIMKDRSRIVELWDNNDGYPPAMVDADEWRPCRNYSFSYCGARSNIIVNWHRRPKELCSRILRLRRQSAMMVVFGKCCCCFLDSTVCWCRNCEQDHSPCTGPNISMRGCRDHICCHICSQGDFGSCYCHLIQAIFIRNM